MDAKGEVGVVDGEQKDGFEGFSVEAVVVEQAGETGDDG